MILRAKGREIAFPRRPLIMGIVNINDDSFCGDGTLDVRQALNQAVRMASAGADIIDAGAESARTNRLPISEEAEAARFLPFITTWNEWADGAERPASLPPDQLWPPLLSINTWRPAVVAAVLPAGGDLLNDISALPVGDNAKLAAAHGTALLIMHSRGQPKQAHTHVGYDDIMAELAAFFQARIALAVAMGLPEESIVLDPGIDFAKQAADNLRIFRELEVLHSLGRPLLLPVSRKTVIGKTLHLSDPRDRDAGTVSCIVSGMMRGAAIFRVHAVEAAVQAVRTIQAITAP